MISCIPIFGPGRSLGELLRLHEAHDVAEEENAS